MKAENGTPEAALFEELRRDRQAAIEFIVGGWFLHGPSIMQHWARAGLTEVADAPGFMQVTKLRELSADFRAIADNIQGYADDCAKVALNRQMHNITGGVQ